MFFFESFYFCKRKMFLETLQDEIFNYIRHSWLFATPTAGFRFLRENTMQHALHLRRHSELRSAQQFTGRVKSQRYSRTPGIAELLNRFTDPIIAVRGNCDSEVDQMLLDFPIMADYALIADNGKTLFLTHGHIYNENNLPKGKFDAFFYGHTHLWKLEKQEMSLCNTGSITFPKGGNPPTFATYENKTISIHQLNGTLLKSIQLT